MPRQCRGQVATSAADDAIDFGRRGSSQRPALSGVEGAYILHNPSETEANFKRVRAGQHCSSSPNGVAAVHVELNTTVLSGYLYGKPASWKRREYAMEKLPLVVKDGCFFQVLRRRYYPREDSTEEMEHALAPHIPAKALGDRPNSIHPESDFHTPSQSLASPRSLHPCRRDSSVHQSCRLPTFHRPFSHSQHRQSQT